MAKKTINLGVTPDGEGGDDIRSAFTKTNENFSELYRDKVSAEAGKQLSDENYTLAEKNKLAGIADEATKNRADSENADKVHTHAISDVDGLDDALLAKFDKTDVVQTTGQSTEKVMSQKVVTEMFTNLIPWVGSTIPSSGIVFDFEKNRYAEKGVPVGLSDISEFIRLSSATKWQDGKLVEVADNVPRISGEGLLIEPQSTNTLTRKLDKFDKRNSTITPLEDGMFELKALATETTKQTGLALYPNVPSNGGQPYSISLVAEAGTYKDARLGYNHSAYSRDNVAFELLGGTFKSKDIPHPDVVMREVGENKYAIGFSNTRVPVYNDFNIFLSDYVGVADYGQYAIFDGTEYLNIGYPQIESDNIVTSYIPTDGTPATRAPDILKVPLLPTQTITGDWDEGVTYETIDNEAVFTGHGYIRNISVEAL